MLKLYLHIMCEIQFVRQHL